MHSRIHYSSKSVVWETPHDFFTAIDVEFGPLTLDVCALPNNAKCLNYFTPEQDGLAQVWAGRCWMNPPYGRGIQYWIKKAQESGISGATIVCLLPARTDAAWWHDYVMKATMCRFLRGRLRFSGQKNNAPFPSALVIFGPL